MRFSRYTCAVLLSGVADAVSASAHHSFAAEFDGHAVIRLTGTLTKVDWANPHTYFYVDVKHDKARSLRGVAKPELPARCHAAASRKSISRSGTPLSLTAIAPKTALT